MELTQRHIENTKLVPNRTILLKHFPKNAVVAEVGVDEGRYSEKILAIAAPRVLHLIDPWESNRYGEGKMKIVGDRFKAHIDSGQVVIHRGHCVDVLRGFADDYFDWVYLDASHRYRETLEELELCRLKVKDGGLIAGHDYTAGNVARAVRYGVVEAVNEICNKYDYRLAYLTNEARRFLSFALQKM
jgi:hypothetical protein